ncbi:helix-turn-helix domain-containing protein [Thioclava sp. GXIMD2076]|uniref:helix-turn-helix domain-containing protein n=1 Tax=Thioclava sp. GXIMD2076 TaxID=3131931 RepID=UPI0030D34CD9
MRIDRHHAGERHSERIQSVIASSSAASRPGVAASWRRSFIHYKLDPSVRPGGERLSARELRLLQEEAGPMIRLAEAHLDRLAANVADAGCSVFLSDARGVVLAERIRAADMGGFQSCNLVAGTDWSEQAEGTNGIGTCAAEERPVTIWRDDHFRESNTALCCSGAPIFGASGALAGVIDVSSARHTLDAAYARLLASSVQETARRIEASLFRQAYEGARIVSLAEEGTGAQEIALLALDRDDLVIGANRAARRRLDLEEAQMGSLPASDLLDGAPRQGLADAQRAEMARALARTGGNVTAAARALGIGRATFYRKAKALGLEV